MFFQTPTKLLERGRFDTIFYVGFSDRLPRDEAVKDGAEISKVVWSDPETLLAESSQQKLWLAPPQVYELSRIANFSDFNAFKTFSSVRSSKGCCTWMPMKVDLADGTVFLYPQDELYPDEPDFAGGQDGQVRSQLSAHFHSSSPTSWLSSGV